MSNKKSGQEEGLEISESAQFSRSRPTRVVSRQRQSTVRSLRSRPRSDRPASPLFCSPSASLNDASVKRLLQCKECSVPLVRLDDVDLKLRSKRRRTKNSKESSKLRKCSVFLQKLDVSHRLDESQGEILEEEGLSPIPGPSCFHLDSLTPSSDLQPSNNQTDGTILVSDDRTEKSSSVVGLSPIPNIVNSDDSNPDLFAEDETLANIQSSGSSTNASEDFFDTSDANVTEMKSFYGYQTMMMHNSQFDDDTDTSLISLMRPDDKSTEISCQSAVFKSKCGPSISELEETSLKFGFFERREKEELKRSVFYSAKSDAGHVISKGIEVNHHKLKLSHEYDVPQFASKFSRSLTLKGTSSKQGFVVFESVTQAPTTAQLLRHGATKPLKIDEKVTPEKLHRHGLKQKSDDESEDSDTTLSESSIESHVTSSTDSEDFLASSQEQLSLRGFTRRSLSRIIPDNVSLNNPMGFKTNFKDLQVSRASKKASFMKILSMELHVVTRSKLLPDPEYDVIAAIFYVTSTDEDCDGVCTKTGEPVVNGFCLSSGILCLNSENVSCPQGNLSLSGVVNQKISYFDNEKELIHAFADFIQASDPDVLTGYEIQQSSWGYLIKRSMIKYDLELPPLLSRMPASSYDSKIISSAKSDSLVTDPDVEIVIAGRIVLCVWRLMKSELALTSYTAENVFYHVLHERIPKFDHQTLTLWWTSTRGDLDRWRVVDYYLIRSHGNIRLLNNLDLIGRTAELARLFGIQFHEVLTRGSQFRVESIMLRLVKARNFIPVSPSVQQRAQMRAPEYLPLVMEPESRFYSDPVVVLDFQSLYPSIMMAYNYCYSTCLGRIVHHLEDQIRNPEPKSRRQKIRFGCSTLEMSVDRLAKLDGYLNFSPGGVAFLKSSVRRGILPQMLKEILDTRIMVKRSMKTHNHETNEDNAALQKVLHSRQLGLKLIANVTYGYTSANFSGRMPCIEVGDSVVSKGRETLERAIHFIEAAAKTQEETDRHVLSDVSLPENSNPKSLWSGARVVYGDTDSLFVLLPGRTRDEAFKIGRQMADEITKLNPKPVKLKFEKVYQPCILQTKKRYVGYMYETPDQLKPVYDAKGIETVRRDGVPAIQKILEKALRILFETKNVSLVKRFVQRQFAKISSCKIPIQDLTFAREFRGLAGYRANACVPALELSRRLSRVDRMALPSSGHRVPYIIVYGEPGRPLFHSVRSPQEVLESQQAEGGSLLRPNSQYYITKVIGPALNRCFSLIGADVMKWFKELPKTKPRSLLLFSEDGQRGNSVRTGQGVILNYFSSSQCIVCDKIFAPTKTNLDDLSSQHVCPPCLKTPQKVAINLSRKIRIFDRTYDQLCRLCGNCAGSQAMGHCKNFDCVISSQRVSSKIEAEQIPGIFNILDSISAEF